MTQPLVDPQLAAFWASDPSILHPQAPPVADPDAGRREHVRREIAASVVVICGLIARDLLTRQPQDPADAVPVARSTWQRHAPLWLRLVVPAIRRAYELGRVEGLTGAELDAMAEDYAATLGDYVGDTSADALADGFNRQLGERWNERLAWHRAASGYGLDKRTMGSWIQGLMNGSKAGRTDVVPPVARALADKALLLRADKIGTDESYSASQNGRAISWLYLLRAGRLPATARRRWETAEDETVCPLCAPLDGQEVPLDEPFVLPDGTKLWSPRAHPGCNCHLRLVGAETLAKSADQPRDRHGRWVTFGELEPHERRAAALYHAQMVDDGLAARSGSPSDYQYRLQHAPVAAFLARYMDAGDEFKQAYGPDDFEAHHRETLSRHVIPHYPADRRWPVIVNDTNVDYVDDGYHRLHSYIRDGATHIPVMRMRPARDIVTKAVVTVAGLCVRAADTGRILMLQRAGDPKDPAAGMWEIPGGHLERGETPLDGARREWEEEVRRKLPASARPCESWICGIYQGFVIDIPSEDLVPSHTRGRVTNPDDPDGDEIEAIAWWEPAHLARNPAVRPELRAALPKLRDALGDVSKTWNEQQHPRDHGRWAHAAAGTAGVAALAGGAFLGRRVLHRPIPVPAMSVHHGPTRPPFGVNHSALVTRNSNTDYTWTNHSHDDRMWKHHPWAIGRNEYVVEGDGTRWRLRAKGFHGGRRDAGGSHGRSVRYVIDLQGDVGDDLGMRLIRAHASEPHQAELGRRLDTIFNDSYDIRQEMADSDVRNLLVHHLSQMDLPAPVRPEHLHAERLMRGETDGVAALYELPTDEEVRLDEALHQGEAVLRGKGKAPSDSGVEKAFGEDSYTRDAHGEFARVESRGLKLRPVLEPDAAIDALLAEIEAGKITEEPSLFAKPDSLFGRSLLTQPSLLSQPSLFAQPSLLKPDSLLAQESLLKPKRQSATRPTRITIRLPFFPPRPDADPDPYYLPYADMRSIEYNASDGMQDHNAWFAPSALVRFSKTNETARFEAENAGDPDPFFGDVEDEDKDLDAAGPHGPALLHAQRASGFRHLTEIFDSEQFDFWGDIGTGAIQDARLEARAAVDDVTTPAGLTDAEIDHIFQLAGYDRRESIPGQRARIVRAVREPKIDLSLANAYADYVAHVRPELVDAETCQNIAAAKESEGLEVEDAPISQIFVFDRGLHPGDVPDGAGQVLIDHDYVVDGVEYITTAGDGDSPLAAYRLVYLSPE